MAKSDAELAAERFTHHVTTPFQPARPKTTDYNWDIGLRMAHSLEYIAAQLGQINARLETIEASFPKKPGAKS